MEVSALTGENVEKLFVTVGELKPICFCFTKFLVTSVDLHHSYNVKRFVTACATKLCAVVCNLN